MEFCLSKPFRCPIGLLDKVLVNKRAKERVAMTVEKAV
jgi:hypothetical protein